MTFPHIPLKYGYNQPLSNKFASFQIGHVITVFYFGGHRFSLFHVARNAKIWRRIVWREEEFRDRNRYSEALAFLCENFRKTLKDLVNNPELKKRGYYVKFKLVPKNEGKITAPKIEPIS